MDSMAFTLTPDSLMQVLDQVTRSFARWCRQSVLQSSTVFYSVLVFAVVFYSVLRPPTSREPHLSPPTINLKRFPFSRVYLHLSWQLFSLHLMTRSLTRMG